MNKTILTGALAMLGLLAAACGSSGDDATWSGGQGGTAGAAGTAGSAGTAGGAGAAGAAGAAGQAGAAGKGGAAGQAGAAGQGGGNPNDKDGDTYDVSVDCDDGNAAINPGAKELCNGFDDNCDQQIDEGVKATFYTDDDSDKFGVDNPATNVIGCTAPAGFADKAGDCSDADPAVNPGAAELCNLVDDNCNGEADEGTKSVFYRDQDGDTWGIDDAATNISSCSPPGGYSSKAGDCDDTNAGINPDAVDIGGNGIDENCDGKQEGCSPGLTECNNNSHRFCDANGIWSVPEDCGSNMCSEIYGCVACIPGTGQCNGNVSHRCMSDGSGWIDSECDPLVGSTCDQGMCTGPCSPQLLGQSYIGCDYYPTVTINNALTNGSAHFAVAVSNTTSQAATVTVHQGASQVAQVSVAANSVQVINLPWTSLKSASATSILTNGAYRLRSTQPVTVYQFNPLEYQAGGDFTYTNDASLLLPSTAWRPAYIVAARNTFVYSSFNYPGFYAVVASEDNTSVTLKPSPTGANVRAGAGVPANGAATITLNRGSVLQVLSGAAAAADLTGTLVTANKPIQVFGGHDCTFVPSNVWACDHLEESMFPISTLSKEYIVSAPSLPSQTQPKAAFTRVIAVEADTALTYDPPNAAWPTSIGASGGYIELDNSSAFRVVADKKVLVNQYMKGQDAGGGSGDPAMALAVTTAQYRKDYLFHAPTNYQYNYVNVIAPAGAAVTLDGKAVPGFVPIGGTGFSVARVLLSNAGNGNHSVLADQNVGITVYGYGQYTSYWYPGGLNLTDL